MKALEHYIHRASPHSRGLLTAACTEFVALPRGQNDAGAPSDDSEAVINEDRERFDWDRILIDEAQDWSDAERDLFTAAYGPRRLVLADGLVQLIRRQTSCNCMLSVPEKRAHRTHAPRFVTHAA